LSGSTLTSPAQTLSLSSNELTISGGNTVTLPGITSLNGQTQTSQSFAPITRTGTFPSWTSVGGVHTLNIPYGVGWADDDGNFINLLANTYNAIMPSANLGNFGDGFGSVSPSTIVINAAGTYKIEYGTSFKATTSGIWTFAPTRTGGVPYTGSKRKMTVVAGQENFVQGTIMIYTATPANIQFSVNPTTANTSAEFYDTFLIITKL
jgi:hypothetical protein